MTILVTGSLALDHIMVFEDHFKNHILPDKIHMLNVSFFIPSMQRCFGGTAGNIAYNLRLLGEDPLILATVGSDFAPYSKWMENRGICQDAIMTLEDELTAQAYITTDLSDNQICAFHAGAMNRAHEARLNTVKKDISIATVSPNGKQAMLDYARDLRDAGIPAMIDPGQGLPLFNGVELMDMIEGAKIYIVNDYEWSLTQEKTGLDEGAIAERVETLVITRGEEGSWVCHGGERMLVPIAPPTEVVDPTGCGDAFRAGLIAGLERGYELETAALMGSLMGSLNVSERLTQSLEVTEDEFRQKFQEAFGEALPSA